MKKIIFLLLLTVAGYGQQTNFPYGIKNAAATTDNTPAYFVTSQTDNIYKKTPAALVAKTATVNDSLATKENVANKSDSYTSSSSTTYASTKALVDGLDLKAPLSSPTFTGTPTAPTAAPGTNTTQIATMEALQAVSIAVQDSLDAIKDKMPVNYAKVVYVNSTSTIFDLANPPVTNDNSLKNDTANLYIASDASTWVYNGSTYVAKSVPASSNFKLVSGVDAGSNKTSSIYREGAISSDGSIGSKIGYYVNRNGSNTAQIGGFYAFSNAAASNIMMFQLNASNGLDLWNYASSTWNKRFTFSSAGDFSTVGNITGGLKVRKISTNTTLADSDNGTIILLTASCTVTLPNGLMNGFNCSFSTLAGATLTYSLGGSVVLFNNLGTTMAEKLSHTIVNTGVSNEYLTAGSL